MASVLLASRSPRRRELLSRILKEFRVVPSAFDESRIQETDPAALVEILAYEKAKAVCAAPDEIVIGSDTAVALDRSIFGIPQTKEEACGMLTRLSGQTHSVITGVCVLAREESHRFTCETKVTFYPLSAREIAQYIETEEPYDKAGGYGIQGTGGLFAEKIEGDYYNVMGLPLSRLYRVLRELKDFTSLLRLY